MKPSAARGFEIAVKMQKHAVSTSDMGCDSDICFCLHRLTSSTEEVQSETCRYVHAVGLANIFRDQKPPRC